MLGGCKPRGWCNRPTDRRATSVAPLRLRGAPAATRSHFVLRSWRLPHGSRGLALVFPSVSRCPVAPGSSGAVGPIRFAPCRALQTAQGGQWHHPTAGREVRQGNACNQFGFSPDCLGHEHRGCPPPNRLPSRPGAAFVFTRCLSGEAAVTAAEMKRLRDGARRARVATRADQGLPAVIEDPAVLQRVARLLVSKQR